MKAEIVHWKIIEKPDSRSKKFSNCKKILSEKCFLRNISQTLHDPTVQWPHPTINSEGRVGVPTSTVFTPLQIGSPNAIMKRRLSIFWKIAQKLFAKRKFFNDARKFCIVSSTKRFYLVIINSCWEITSDSHFWRQGEANPRFSHLWMKDRCIPPHLGQ